MKLLSRLGLSRPELRAWAMYDWANSAFWSTIVTAVFPPFFSRYAAAGLDAVEATARFAWATTIAATIIAFLGPVLGAMADHRGWKKRLLGVFVLIGVGATLMMVAIQQSGWVLALALFVVANIGVATAQVFYDALLPHVAGPDEIDRVSTAGFAVGFFGGGIVLLLNLAWILSPSTWGLPDGIAAIKLSFVSVAVWWLLFSIPLFRRVHEPPPAAAHATAARADAVHFAFREAWTTLRELRRRYPQAFLMLVAFLLYNDGIQTIIRMAAIYGAEVGLDQNAQIAAFVVVQFVGVPCSFAFGALADRVGAKRSLFGALMVYTGISVLGYFMRSESQFFALAALVGMVQGGSQALSRSLFARMIPKDKSSEYFGFFSVFEKFAGIAGPAMFAASVTVFGSSRAAVLSVIFFFVAGALVLTRVNVAEGEAQAARAA
jgi:UMF1 family MFS transporter